MGEADEDPAVSSNGTRDKAIVAYFSTPVFDPERPVSDYHPEIQERFRETAGAFLREMEDSKLEVKLVDTEDPRHSSHKKRAAERSNPAWYQTLFTEFARDTRRNQEAQKGNNKKRVRDSNIKRPRIMQALEMIRDGKDVPYRKRKLHRRTIEEKEGEPLEPNGGFIFYREQVIVRELIFQYLTDEVETDFGPSEPDPKVCSYFGLDSDDPESALDDIVDQDQTIPDDSPDNDVPF